MEGMDLKETKSLSKEQAASFITPAFTMHPASLTPQESHIRTISFFKIFQRGLSLPVLGAGAFGSQIPEVGGARSRWEPARLLWSSPHLRPGFSLRSPLQVKTPLCWTQTSCTPMTSFILATFLETTDAPASLHHRGIAMRWGRLGSEAVMVQACSLNLIVNTGQKP